jgi:nucleotide-binding universal stress UspA family protein
VNVTEILPVRGGPAVELDQDHKGIQAARLYGKQLELAGVPVKVELERAFPGEVARRIVEAAREHQAGVIVMGSHGRGDFTALLLGSVAHKVIHLADRPVLIAR